MESTLLLRAACAVLFITGCVSGCNRGLYERVIDQYCLAKFKFDMEAVDQRLWCSWPDTTEVYEGLTNCTYQVSLRMDCFWPDQIVDHFFVRIHQNYFHDCPLTGRLIHDPPFSVLAPLIGVPILVTLLVTSLVVWRSKHTEGLL
ncbi:receptor activity-modifying protein 1-like isoform X1 [Phyllopteryx taeniolatus]|uniref:receptor activity-modifying protein 1-like isoform X1 n=1 Tax=Phyllopteryx taeniolatus TaxID=161469 RepID=UPI002AD259ED|nr:receptor activity-modifying protein 1-like isoform X1 [Phyllopteryx taeniolatus]